MAISKGRQAYVYELLYLFVNECQIRQQTNGRNQSTTALLNNCIPEILPESRDITDTPKSHTVHASNFTGERHYSPAVFIVGSRTITTGLCRAWSQADSKCQTSPHTISDRPAGTPNLHTAPGPIIGSAVFPYCRLTYKMNYNYTCVQHKPSAHG